MGAALYGVSKLGLYRLYLKNWKGNYSRAVDEQKIRRTKKKYVVNKILGYETKTSRPRGGKFKIHPGQQTPSYATVYLLSHWHS